MFGDRNNFGVDTKKHKFIFIKILAILCSGVFKERRARYLLQDPLFRAPSRCFVHKFSSFLVKSVLSTHIIYSEADHKQVLSKVPPTATAICRYSAFKGAPIATVMRKYPAFDFPSTANECVSALLSKGPPRATVKLEKRKAMPACYLLTFMCF